MIGLMLIIMHTDFFENSFGATLYSAKGQPKDPNDPKIDMVIYLQVSMISLALIFVTRAHGFFFTEHPSYALMLAFVVAQAVSSIIAAYADSGFTKIHSVEGA